MESQKMARTAFESRAASKKKKVSERGEEGR